MHGLESPFVLSCGETDFYRMGFKILRIGSLELSFAPALLWALPVQSWGCDDAQVSDWPRCHFPPCNPKSSRFTSLHLTAVRASLYLNLGGDADGVLDKEIKKETIYTDPQGLGFSGSYFVLGGWGGWDDDVPCMCTHVRCYTTVASLLHTCSMLRNCSGGLGGLGWCPLPCRHVACYGKHSLDTDVTCSAPTCWNLWTTDVLSVESFNLRRHTDQARTRKKPDWHHR